MDFPDETVTSNEISRGHSSQFKGAPRVARLVYRNRVIHGIAGEEIQGIFVNIVDADRDYAKILRCKFLTYSIQCRQRKPTWTAPTCPKIQISDAPYKR